MDSGVLIGQGSFSKVFLVHIDEKPFAVKQIPLKNLKGCNTTSDEIKLLQKLKHPNVIKIHGSNASEDYTHLILDYCNGGDLNSFVKRFGPNFKESLV
jgi:serine/threonine protein kinase